jgi:ketosteroid isomerase-like protein
MLTAVTKLDDRARRWMVDFARAVRERDFAAGRRLFAPEVIGYGTVCRRADGLAELERRQWSRVWPVTRDFDFDYRDAVSLACGDGLMVLAQWRSVGCEGSRELGERRGRSTILLRESPGGLQAVHTHFSLDPS